MPDTPPKDHDEFSEHGDEDEDLPPLFRALCNQNMAYMTSAAIRDHPNPAFATFLREINDFAKRILSTIKDPEFYKYLLHTTGHYIKDHPWQTAFFIIGIVLICNPVGMAGFGALGPVAGSLAAAWQASIGGTVAAGSAFAVLQSLGMTGEVAIHSAGAAIAAVAAAAPIWARVWGNASK